MVDGPDVPMGGGGGNVVVGGIGVVKALVLSPWTSLLTMPLFLVMSLPSLSSLLVSCWNGIFDSSIVAIIFTIEIRECLDIWPYLILWDDFDGRI